ncbi:MAG: BatA domain-containing protein, partial [Acidobacteriota bacterium]
MFLLSPAWLAVLAAAALPVLLHLISRGRYRRIRIGNVRLIPGDPARRGRRFRPSQLLLLAVRCALLAALALALAGPRSVQPASENSEGPAWVLASAEALKLRERLEPENRAAYARLDRLVAGGAELRLLAAGAPRVAAALPDPDDRPDDWSLLREADALAPADVSFHVLTVDRATALRGERPRLARRVEWDALRPAGLNRWIEAVGAPESAGIPVVVGTSDPDGTYFRPGRETPRADGTVTLADGGLRGDDDSAAVPATVRVGLFHDPDRGADAGYVRAAVAAVAGVTTIPVAIAAAGPFDIRFHLSATPVPADWLETLAGGGILVS